MIGVVTGYLVDFVMSKKYYGGTLPEVKSSHAVEIKQELEKTKYLEIALHTLKRTMRIYLWVLLITIIISLALVYSNTNQLIRAIQSHTNIQIVVAALFGLIPNCAASIAIAEAFLHAGLSLGATIAGLGTGAGFGPIVLFKDGKLSFAIQALLISLTAAILWGYAINYFI